MRSADVPTSTNKAYELVKRAGEGGKRRVVGGGGEGGVARGRGGEDDYEYDVVLAHPQVQPVAAGEGGYAYIP